MSKYTTEVRYICEVAAGLDESVGFDDVDNVTLSNENVARVFEKIDYPIFDEAYRPVLNKKILMHFYTREIGFETVGLWKLKMKTKLNEIMPYYNKLYRSELLEFNPLYDVDLTTTRTKSGEGTTNTVSNGTRSEESTNVVNKVGSQDETYQSGVVNNGGSTDTHVESGSTHNTNRFSDTPQGDLTGMGNIENNMWLTNATLDDGSHSMNSTDTNTHNDTTNTNSTKGVDTSETERADYNEMGTDSRTGVEVVNTTEDYVETVVGKRGGWSYSKALEEFRKTFLNIDVKVLNELDELFMRLW